MLKKCAETRDFQASRLKRGESTPFISYYKDMDLKNIFLDGGQEKDPYCNGKFSLSYPRKSTQSIFDAFS